MWDKLLSLLGMPRRYTDRARLSMVYANRAAHLADSQEIAATHIVIGILDEGTGVGFHALRYLGVDPQSLRAQLDRPVRESPNPDIPSRLPLAEDARALIANASTEARQIGDDYVGTQHLLLAVLRDSGDAPLDVAEQLRKLGVTHERFQRSVTDVLRPVPN